MSFFSKIARWFKGVKKPEPAAGPDIDNGFSDDFGDEGTEGEGDQAQDNPNGIVSFSYSYHGSIGGGSYTYSVKAGGIDALENGAATLTVDHMEHPEYGEMTGELPENFMAELYKLYKECRLAAWNGFDKYNPHVCDGSGFSLSIRFADKKSVNAHGSNSFPKGYRAFCDRMEALFKPEVDKLLEKARQERIAEGLGGELDSMLAVFKQRGESGSDEYDIMIMKSGIRSCNFDVNIRSESGEFFPEGRYRYYCDVPDEALDLPGFDAICRKYDIIRWYDYDKAAEDYNNCEWFQLSFGFGDSNLNAMGTAHPEGYDGFRREYLEHLRAVVDNAKANYGVTEYD